MSLLPDDEDFDKRWLHDSTTEQNMSVVANIHAVKEFAYQSFDRLDQDKNGFIESNELQDLLEGESLNNREKSFVMFLLNNQEQIAGMSQDDQDDDPPGISRADLDLYFELLANLL
ncbi:MAG: hypothetical protein K2W95_16180 [Candidatus Obscuribacterales bacterium]|nr:hypothetical protein [Candidatus Obscuribacterales bacterium]